MNLENYRGIPPETAEEWRQFYRMLDEWEQHGGVVKDIAILVKGTMLIRLLAPYALLFAGLMAAIYNRDMLGGLIP